MTQNGMRVGAAMTFWSLAEFTDRDMLSHSWGREGFSEFVPEPRQPNAALYDALHSIFKGPQVLIRPLKKREGWCVVTEQRGEDENQYKTLLSANVTPRGGISVTPFSDAYATIVDQFERHLGLLRQSQVSTALVSILGRVGATALRPKGGLYSVPGPKIDDWANLAKATEEAGSGNKIYLLRHIMDADAMRAIRDAIVAEVTAEAARINKEVAHDELGDRALETRRTQAQELREKVLMYEELLSSPLPHLHHALGEAEEAAARAVLLASVESV
jgi:hypothetical protein